LSAGGAIDLWRSGRQRQAARICDPKQGYIDMTPVGELLLDFYARETSFDQFGDEFMREAMRR
jgi:hypothetical protein